MFTRSRLSLFPPGEMLVELKETLETEAAGEIDWITFVGTGEPTLNADLGTMLRGVKAMTAIPVAVITNGSLLSLRDVREELAVADAVMPTLDAGNADLFQRINRPPSELRFDRHLEGLVDFKAGYAGRLWLEVMLVSGLNDGEAALGDLAMAVSRIAPDQVHLVLPDRPSCEAWVRPADEEAVLRAHSILGKSVHVVQPDERYGDFGAKSESDPLAAVAAILSRHPMSRDELCATLGRWGVEDPASGVQSLVASGRATVIARNGKAFLKGI